MATFVTEPSLQVPTLSILKRSSPSPGLLFVTTLTGPGQRGPMILDDRGRLVWFKKTQNVAINFRRQIYKGRPVLTWWEGTISNIGTGEGEGVIVDATYKEIARVRAGNGFDADVHEFLITPEGTALITIYNAEDRRPDARSAARCAPGRSTRSLQEIDIATRQRALRVAQPRPRRDSRQLVAGA